MSTISRNTRSRIKELHREFIDELNAYNKYHGTNYRNTRFYIKKNLKNAEPIVKALEKLHKVPLKEPWLQGRDLTYRQIIDAGYEPIQIEILKSFKSQDNFASVEIEQIHAPYEQSLLNAVAAYYIDRARLVYGGESIDAYKYKIKIYKLLNGATAGKLMDRVYAGLSIAQFVGQSVDAKYTCSIQALVNCGYPISELRETFGNIEPGVKIHIGKVIDYIENRISHGAIVLLDAFHGIVYESDATKGNKDLKKYFAMLADGHVHEYPHGKKGLRMKRLNSTLFDTRGHASHAKAPTIDIRRETSSKGIALIQMGYAEIDAQFKKHMFEDRCVPAQYKIVDGMIRKYRRGDIVYTSNPDLELVQHIVGKKDSDRGLASVVLDIFMEHCKREGFDPTSIMNSEATKIWDSVEPGPKHFMVRDGIVKDSIDLCKAYSYAWESTDGILKFGCTSELEACHITHKSRVEDILPGLYILSWSPDTMLFRGPSKSDHNIVREAILAGVPFLCERRMVGELVGTGDFMKRFADEIYEFYGNDSAKKIMNTLIGVMNKKSKNITKNTAIVMDPSDAMHYHETYGAKIKQHGGLVYEADEDINDIGTLGNAKIYAEINAKICSDIDDKIYYTCEVQEVEEKFRTLRPLFLQIINQHYINMYRKIREIGPQNILGFKTDTLMLSVPYEGNVGTNRGDWRKVIVPDPIHRHYDPTSLHVTIPMVAEIPAWNDFGGIRDIPDGASVLITGKPGAGKTHMIKEYCEGKRVLKLSFTGAAALNMGQGGRTFHSFLNGSLTVTDLKIREIRTQYDVIFIDEISMLSSEFWASLAAIRKGVPNVPMLLAGDFDQIPPIGEEHIDYRNARIVRELAGYNRIVIHGSRRCEFDLDTKFEERKGFTSLVRCAQQDTHTRAIVYRNTTRRMFADALLCSWSLPVSRGGFGIKYADVPAGWRSEKFKLGMPMVSKETNRKLAMINNELYEIVAIDGEVGLYCGEWNRKNDQDSNNALHRMDFAKFKDTKITMKSVNESKIMGYEVTKTFSYYDLCTKFNYGFAMTVYQAQGQTFDFPYLVLDYDIMTEPMRYVAISRAKKLDQLVNLQPMAYK